jgi:iron(II)-dependent oxidoreductase
MPSSDPVDAVLAYLLQQTRLIRGGDSPAFPGNLLALPFDRPLPLWFDVCRALFLVPGDPLNNRHNAKTLREHVTSKDLRFTDGTGHAANAADGAATPQHIARLAAAIGGRAPFPGTASLTRQSPSLQDDLIIKALQSLANDTAAAKEDDPDARLDMVQLLISSVSLPRGELSRLVLRRVGGDHPSECGRLVRAPAAALMRLDSDFSDGLASAQALLDRVLVKGAPSVAWSLCGLPERDPKTSVQTTQAPAVRDLKGNSASAAIAYGALYLLRRHLRNEYAGERLALEVSEPQRISVSAALCRPGGTDAGLAVWPELARVGELDYKLEVIARLPTRRALARIYAAQGQYSNAPETGCATVSSLHDLIHRVAGDANSALSADERALYATLLGDDADRNRDSDHYRSLLERVAEGPPPRGITGHLLRSYARHASGRSSPFRLPQQLDQHFVNLHLQFGTAQASDAGDANGHDREKQLTGSDLGQLLHGHEFIKVTAWVLVGGPLAGKTTLLAQWMMRSAREALRRQRNGQGWGEVCVFLPMRNFSAVLADNKDDIGAALATLAAQQAPGLPSLPALLSDTSPEPTLRVRLLIDGLNEVAAPSWGEREQIVQRVCRWIASHPHGRLAPVFSVREFEFGMDLQIDDAVSRLRPVQATLQAWDVPQIERYIDARRLDPSDRERLLAAIRASSERESDDGSFAGFCGVPGVLAGQCTLLEDARGSPLPQRRGQLLMALLWSALAALKSRLPHEPLDDNLVPKAVRDRVNDLKTMLARNDLSLPEAAGLLLDGLAAQARAMQDRSAVDDAPLKVPPNLLGAKDRLARSRWLRYSTVLGLGQEYGGRWSFTHQQWLELFAALGLKPDAALDLAPPALNPPDEASLLNHLGSGGDLQLPPVRQRERLLFTADLCAPADVERWIRRLIDENLPLAAHVAIAHRARLEPDPWTRPHLLLQHLRRLLLLRSVDAGAAVRERVLASGIESAVGTVADGADANLRWAWQSAWASAFREAGVDVRLRIEAGLLLGELGDTLRYERVPGHPGLRLREAHWIGTGADVHAAMASGAAARKQTFRIGGDPRPGYDDEEPGFDLELEGFAIAAYPVTVAEFKAFVDDGGYESDELPWWPDQGPAAQAWLRQRQADARAGGEVVQPWTLNESRYNNPAQPITGITWWEAMAYARWAASLYERHGNHWKLCVPTEVQWEAAVRGPHKQGSAFLSWPHPGGDAKPDALCFNHSQTRWRRSTPVGVFSRGYSLAGVADAAGNAWEWCAYEYEATYRRERGVHAGGPPPDPADVEAPRAARGGGFINSADAARAGSRSHLRPGSVNYAGVRLVRVRLPH